ncbi:MAG: F0F1 ATP synthase subunit epsilon [Aeromicrobium erythreum]
MASDTTLQVEVVAADRVVWSGAARQLSARTSEGDLGVLPGHAPLLSVLVPSVVRIEAAEGDTVVAAVEEGFISVADDRVSVLSEDAALAAEIDVDQARSDLEAAGEDLVLVRRAEAKLRAAGALD